MVQYYTVPCNRSVSVDHAFIVPVSGRASTITIYSNGQIGKFHTLGMWFFKQVQFCQKPSIASGKNQNQAQHGNVVL